MSTEPKPTCRSRRFSKVSLASSFFAAVLALALGVVLFLSVQTLGTQYNLYYLLWKAGIRKYEPQVALAGMFHDHAFRQRFIGMSRADFERRFPSTFYQLRRQPPIATAGEVYFISDYRQATDDSGAFGMCWMAVFRDDRLVAFDYAKA
jgi:hypothetical protein